jgi:NAD-dependent deacetylase
MRGNLDTITGLFKAHASGKILVVTGAGISLASGIATFRGQDPGAIWKKDVMELGTFRYFSQDPVGSWRCRRSSPPPGPWLRAPPARDLRKHR